MDHGFNRQLPILVVVLLALGATTLAVVLLSRDDSNGPAAVGSSDPSPSGTAPTAPSPSSAAPSTAALTPQPAPAGPPQIAWTQQEWPGAVEAAYTDATSAQILVAGAVGDRGEDLVVWTSDDGATWEQRDVPEPSQEVASGASPGTPYMRVLARFTDTLFAFGIVVGPLDNVRPVAWRSDDGHVWEPIASDNEFYADAFQLLDVEASDGEILAVTHGFRSPSGGTWRWTPDGSWEQTTPGGVDFRESQLALADAARGPDRFVLVGGLSESRAIAYISPDGRSWEEAPAVPALDGAQMYAVTPGGSGEYVAVGVQAGQAAAWISPDGLTWEAAALPNATGAEAHLVVAVPGGFLALGPSLADADVTRTWTSRDGRTWLEGQALEGHLPGSLLGADQGVVATEAEVLVFLTVGGGADEAQRHLLWRGAIGD